MRNAIVINVVICLILVVTLIYHAFGALGLLLDDYGVNSLKLESKSFTKGN